MIARIQLSFRKSAWLLAMLFITSVLPAHAQDDDEYYVDEWYFEAGYQEDLFNFEYDSDLGGYIISPKNFNENELIVPSTYLKTGAPVVGLSGFGSYTRLERIVYERPCNLKKICDNCFQYCES
ncbi:MAG: hypothetical protein ACI30C_09635, partial [Muribaculaceae bacterium]